MLPLRIVVLSALLGLTIALPVAAQWKWRDKSGQMQYSDLPPPSGTAEQDILQRPVPMQQLRPAAPASGASAAAAAKGVDHELEARRRKAEQDQAARQKAEDDRVAAARADNCTRAKSYLRTLDDGMRIARMNDKGEREYLDDQARAEEARRTRAVVASDCK
jgi:hypothetical protein